MADVAENKPTEQVADQAPAAAAPATTEAEKSTEASDKPAEATATTTTTTTTTTEDKPEQNNERKRRGSFQDRRGGDNKRGRGRDGFRGGFRGNKDRQNKSRFESLPESDDAGEIRRQVEFYFSDSNLPIDAHLLKLSGGKENNPVPLKTIHDFKRMRHFQPYSAVRDAVAASKFLNLSEDDQITRKNPLADKFGDDVEENKKIAGTANMARSVYAKGFGPEDEKTQLDIEEYFEPYGPVTAVRLRRADDGLFKGSVFAEFETEEAAKAFLELDPKPAFNDKDLQIMSKQAYVDKKTEDIKEGRVRPRSPSRTGGQKHHSTNRDGGDNWKQSRDNFQRGGRGGGRGRGGRGGRGGDRGGRGRGGRGGRTGDRNAEREAQQQQDGENKKRSRDEGEGESKQPEAKKVKEDAPAPAAEA